MKTKPVNVRLKLTESELTSFYYFLRNAAMSTDSFYPYSEIEAVIAQLEKKTKRCNL